MPVSSSPSFIAQQQFVLTQLAWLTYDHERTQNRDRSQDIKETSNSHAFIRKEPSRARLLGRGT